MWWQSAHSSTLYNYPTEDGSWNYSNYYHYYCDRQTLVAFQNNHFGFFLFLTYDYAWQHFQFSNVPIVFNCLPRKYHCGEKEKSFWKHLKCKNKKISQYYSLLISYSVSPHCRLSSLDNVIVNGSHYCKSRGASRISDMIGLPLLLLLLFVWGLGLAGSK